jgi:hypothetical protein
MDYDQDKVDEMTLALLWLTRFKDPVGIRAWKGQDWETMGRLHSKGYITDPKSKAKSVVLSEEGEKRSRELFAKYFSDVIQQVIERIARMGQPHFWGSLQVIDGLRVGRRPDHLASRAAREEVSLPSPCCAGKRPGQIIATERKQFAEGIPVPFRTLFGGEVP